MTRTRFILLASIAVGLGLGLLLELVVFVGAEEAEITGGALLALGAGFSLLAIASTRLTNEPQRWALVPGSAAGLGGALLLALAPGDRILGLAGWVWPALLLAVVTWSVRGARRSLDSWSRRAVLYPSLVVLLLVAAGGAFETVSAATSTSTAPGRSYLVNGHRLYLNCVGTGQPTVVLFNGLGERTPSWSWVQQRVSATTRVCTFDRASEGWSGAGPARQDGHQLALDVHQLLRVARVPGPYVLAGHSVGGVYALLYAKQYPRDVAGIALIDSATPYQFELPDYPRFYSMARRLYSVMPVLARAGLARLVLGGGFASSPRELRADQADFEELPTVFDQAKALKSLGAKPLAVVTAGAGEQRGWLTAQKKLARLSSNSTQETVVGATHAALLDDKGFAWFTTRAITRLVRHAR